MYFRPPPLKITQLRPWLSQIHIEYFWQYNNPMDYFVPSSIHPNNLLTITGLARIFWFYNFDSFVYSGQALMPLSFEIRISTIS